MEKSVSLRVNGSRRTVVLTVMEEDQTLLRYGKNNTPQALPESGPYHQPQAAGRDGAQAWRSG